MIRLFRVNAYCFSSISKPCCAITAWSAGLAKPRCLLNNITKPSVLKTNIIAIMGRAVPVSSRPTNDEATAPHTICKPPSRADALPARWVKGAIASATELGKMKP